MTNRFLSTTLTASLCALVLYGCGGTSINSDDGGGGDGNGGGGGTGLSISVLAPSVVMVGVPQGAVTILGQGFTQQSQVLLDGQPTLQTTFTNSGTLQAEVNISLSVTTGTHQFSVQNGSSVSNTLPYTIYAPQQGPFVMQAIPGFLVAENTSYPSFIVAADTNGDGLADVVMPGPGITNSESIAVLLGQTNGLLSAPQYVPVPTTPAALAVGDVDGNGTADLVSISSENGAGGSTTVSILLGEGQGKLPNAFRAANLHRNLSRPSISG
jgi:FG-GAP-like repeat